MCYAQIVAPALVTMAQKEIGHGESGRDSYGLDIRRYLQGQQGQSWCAGFVSYCLSKSGYKLPYVRRAKNFLKMGKIVKNPKSGDLIVFWRGNPNGTAGHVGIVESVTKDTITTIEGNTGNYPSKVKRITYQKNNIKRFLGFVRLKEVK
jgi:uncharacterized protein (TIGR02594 family)